MKLTQELVVTIVFLGGSWVTLSVVAVAFPPTTSSIRAAISANTQTSHIKVASPLAQSTAQVPAEDVLPTEDTTTFLQDEKPDVVQVVASDAKKDELFILGENDAVPEKLIEDNPDAKMVVMGADEAIAKSKLDKFNVAAKNVAIRVALAKQAATRQAQADFAKLRDWRENGSHFALEVKAKRFEYSLHDVLQDKLEEVADMPELHPTSAPMNALPVMQNSNPAPNQFSMLQDKLISWRDNALRFASDFSAKEELHQVIGSLDSKSNKMPSVSAPQAAAPQPAINSAAAPKEGKAEIKSLDVRPLNEKLTLEFKAKPFSFNVLQPLNSELMAMITEQQAQSSAQHPVAAKPVQVATIAKPVPVAVPSFEMPTIDTKAALDTSAHRYSFQNKSTLTPALIAMTQHETDLPLSSAVVYQPAVESVKAIVATQPAKAVAVTASVNTVVNAEPVTVLPPAILAMTEPKTSYSPVPADTLTPADVKLVEIKANKPLDINKVHAATTKVLQQSAVKALATRDKSATKTAAQLAAAKALHLKQLAMADAKHKKAVARENAIASLERQLSSEPAVIVVPAKPAQQRRMASVEKSHAEVRRPQYQSQAAPRSVEQAQPMAHNEETQQTRAQQMARRQSVEKDPFEEYFEQQEQKNREINADRQTTNVASMDLPPSDEEARDIAGDMHQPEEYSRLMEE